MAEVKIKFSAETAEAQKQLDELRKVGEATQKRLAEGGQGDRRTDLEALRTAKEQLVAAEEEKRIIQEKTALQAQAVRQAEAAVSATAEGTREHSAATRELQKQQGILENLKSLGKIKAQSVDVAAANVETARRVTRAETRIEVPEPAPVPAPAPNSYSAPLTAGSLEDAKKDLSELEKSSARIKKNLSEASPDRRSALETLRAAKEQLAAAEKEKQQIQEKIKAQAQVVRQAQAAAAATAENTDEHEEATRELQKQQGILENLKSLGKIKAQTVDVARSNVETVRGHLRQTATAVTPKVNSAPAVSGFARIRAAATSTVAKIKSGFASASASIGKAFTGMKAAAGAALAYVGINSCKQVINELDNLSKHARSLDIDTASFQKLKYAADSNNVSFEQVESSIGKMKRTIGEAANGSAEAEKKLALLGLTLQDLQGKTTAQQFDLIAQSITSIQDPAQRTAAAMKWFEEGGAKMLDFLKNYKQMGEELAARGGIIDDKQLKAAEDFNQALTDMNVQLKAIIANSGLLPKLSEALQESVFYWTGGEERAEKQGSQRGVYRRKTGAAFAAEKIIESGKYTPEQQERIRKAAARYGEGMGAAEQVRTGRATAPVKNDYSGEYALIDAELQKRGMGAIARQKAKGFWGGEYMKFGDDTTVTARQTEEERRAEAEKIKKAKEEKAAAAAEREAKRKAAQAAAEAEAQRVRDSKSEQFVKDMEERVRLQKMINEGKGKEVAIEEALNRARKNAESLGTKLTVEQEKRIRTAAAAGYDLAHPEKALPEGKTSPVNKKDAVEDHIRSLEKRYRLQQMINQGKGKEAAIEEALNRARKQAESAGTKLTEEQEQRIRTVTAASYDLSHPAKSAAAALQPPPRTPDNYVTYGLRSVGGMIAGASRAGTFSTDYNRINSERLSTMQNQLGEINAKLPGRTEVQNVKVSL